MSAYAPGDTVTVQPVTTIVSTLPPGGITTSGLSGSSDVYSSTRTIGGSAGPTAGGDDACLCYTCALTPTVIPGCTSGTGDGGSGGGGTGTGMTPGGGMCTARNGIGTTTLFTTHTITTCDMPGVCPAPGYVIGGNATQSGATIVTTTDKGGHAVTYTQIPTGGGGGGGTATATTSSTAQPTCPYSDNVIFTSPMGMQYQVFCDEAFTDESLEIQTQSSLGSCIAACDMYNVRSFMIASPCMGVSYSRSVESDNCELKTGYSRIYQRNVDSARLLSPYEGGGGNSTGPGGGIGTMTSPPVLSTYGTGAGKQKVKLGTDFDSC